MWPAPSAANKDCDIYTIIIRNNRAAAAAIIILVVIDKYILLLAKIIIPTATHIISTEIHQLKGG